MSSPREGTRVEDEERTAFELREMENTTNALATMMAALARMNDDMRQFKEVITEVKDKVTRHDEALETISNTPSNDRVTTPTSRHSEIPPLSQTPIVSGLEARQPTEDENHWINYDTVDIGPRIARRESYRASFDLNQDVDARRSLTANRPASINPNAPPAPVQVLHQQKDVPRLYMMTVISIANLLKTLDFQTIFQNEFAQGKALVYFIDSNLLEELLRNEESMGTAAGILTLADMYGLPDSAIVLMVVNLVRNRYTLDHNSLSRTVMGLGPVLKATSPTYEFGVKDYDIYLHPMMQKWLKARERGWLLLIKNITSDEKDTWLKEKWVTGKVPQMLNVIMESLGVFQDPFERLITVDVLKKQDRVLDLLQLLRKEDRQLNEDARKLRARDAKGKPFTPLNQIREQMDRNKPVQIFRKKEESEKRSAPSFGSSSYPKMPGHKPPHLSSVEFEEEADQSFASEDIHAQVRPAWEPSDRSFAFEDDDVSDGEAGLAALMQVASGGKYQKPLYDPKAKGPIDVSSKPCFTHFHKGCNGGCGGYSHDPQVMEKYSYKLLSELYHSKYGGASRIQRNLDRIVQEQSQPNQNRGPSYSAQPKPRLTVMSTEPDLMGASAAGGGPGPVKPEPDS